MNLKHTYLALCVIGTVFPYLAFVPWLAENGLNLPLLVRQIASSPVALFGWWDVVISAATLFVFVWADNQQTKVRYVWLPIIGTLTVGVSLGLPLYLFLRELSKHE